MKLQRCISGLVFMMAASLCLAQSQPEAPTSQPSSEPESGPAFFIWPEPAKLEGPLATDRPGFSNTAFLVPRGHAHLEIGHIYSYDQEKHTETQNHLVPGTSLRVGLLDDLEFRVGWSGMSLTESKFRDVTPGGRTFTNHQHDDGATDMSVGFKAPLLKHDDTNYLPNLSVVPALSLPTGGRTKTSDDVDPSLLLAWNYPVTGKFLVYGVGSIASVTDPEGSRFSQTAASLAGSYSVSDQLSFFIEYFGIYPSTHHTDCQHNLNGGPVYLITDNIQLDLAIGLGLNEEAPDFFVNWGLSIRF
ncbi:MAG TPA: transporter [Phycisphaerae bacterium]|nr:transporter [Phycisphaerae bacterium]